MAKFDIIDAAGRAYLKSWEERRYLLRLAAVPFLIQLACLTLASAVAEDTAGYLRFALIMVPAWLAEGWMLCHYVRLLARDERWPFSSTGDRARDMAIIAPRARGVLSGLIVYTLTHMAIALMTAGVFRLFSPYMPVAPDAPPPDIPAWAALSSFVLLGACVWGLRVVWIYIPASLNGSIGDYFLKLRGIGTSFYMAGLWLLCLMPFIALLQFGIFVLANPVASVMGAGAGAFTTLVISVIMDMTKGIVVTAGMTYALGEIYAGGKQDRGRSS